MHPNIIIRNETETDIDKITDVTIKAFKTLEISNNTEQLIIKAVRADGVLTEVGD